MIGQGGAMMDPVSVDEYVASLARRADVPIEHSKPLRLYLRSADALFKQVKHSHHVPISNWIGLCI